MARRLTVLAALAAVALLVGGYLALPSLPGPDGSPSQTDGASPTSVIPSTSTSGTPGSPSPTPSGSPGPSSPPPAPVALGAFIPGAPKSPAKIDAYAKLVGVKPRVVMWYQAWAGTYSGFPAAEANAVRARGAMPMISWEPSAGKATDRSWALSTILNGSHDAYIRSWTRAVARWGHPIYVRLMYEMNGPWSPWGYGVNDNTPAQFVAAWRHVVKIARAQHATNVRWFWCPNIDPTGRAGPYSQYYPGDSYVDYVGLDGFNWGVSTSAALWRDVGQLFQGPVAQLRLTTSKPLIIGETAANDGPDKAAWITDGLAQIGTLLPGLRAVIWYDQEDPAGKADWRIDSSSDALAAFRSMAKSSSFAGRLR